MTRLADIVDINRRFARSARLDADLNGTPPLVGYVLQASVDKALTTIASSQIDKQGAYTWTGPYGGGKSSAALFMANLIAGAPENKKIARKIAGETRTKRYERAFPSAGGNWAIVAVTGARAKLRASIIEAAATCLGWSEAKRHAADASDEALIDALIAAAAERGGLLLILDELGKLLEHEALNGGDVHLLQDLAERSTRSDGKFVVVGILHQAFDQYASRLTREARREWVKVQGRYQDIPFLSGVDETVALLGRAITASARPDSALLEAQIVASAIARRRPVDEAAIAQSLSAAWPLNPVTALLLGPVSRQRFAQNERSVFGFLSSAEPWGFQDHLKSAASNKTYDPDKLWDYLASNFGMALAGGTDGSRFSLAFEAIERASAKGGALHVALTKSAAIIEFFRNGSGLAVADDFLLASVPSAPDAAKRTAIADLVEWAVLIRQPRLNGYALFAGSDFDIEDAIARATSPLTAEQVAGLAHHVGLGFTVAKRHYFRTGALRSFEVVVQLVGEADTNEALVAAMRARAGKTSNGQLVLLINDGTLDGSSLEKKARSIARAHGREAVIAVGAAADSYMLRSSAAELFAIERVVRDHPQLEGDRIARREIAARQSAAVDAVYRALSSALDLAHWSFAPKPDLIVREPLTMIATALSDAAFPDSPVLRSELLQRDRPSSNAMAAVRELCHAMVTKANLADLGFEGYPAAMGLYLTVIKPFGIHRQGEDGRFGFYAPSHDGQGATLRPSWDLLETANDITLDMIYNRWAKTPFGLKLGVMPVLVLANLIANRHRLAVYLDGVFQTGLDEVFVDKLLQKPGDIRLRRVDRSIKEAVFLSDLAQKFEIGDGAAALTVAQSLFRRYSRLPNYAKRTNTISEQAQAIRSVVLKSSDPEALLFDDLPAALGEGLDANAVYTALTEAETSYEALQKTLLDALCRALAVDADFGGLSARAETIKNLTNDYAFEAFAMRAAAFETSAHDIEGIASLLLHKPLHGWSDRDREQGLLQLARYGRQFRELEALAVVRDRKSNTEALALVVGVDPKVPPVIRSVVLTEAERREATLLADRLTETLGDKNLSRVRFAALARAVANLAAENDMETLS